MPADAPDDLAPGVTRRPTLPEEFQRSRLAQTAKDERDRIVYEERIEAHITVHGIALDFLEETLQWVAECTDLDLVGDTRPAALWQMGGRSLGICRLILDALRMGYTAEVLHLARAAHEANRLLIVFRIPEEEALLRQWLVDEKWVRPKAAREAEDRFERRLAEAMRSQGFDELPNTKKLNEQIYGQHSEAAHHRRRWTQDAVFPDLRTMIRGRTGHWMRRVGTTAAMVGVVEESVTQIGDALSYLLGPSWYEERVKPLQQTFQALRVTKPLP